MCMVASPFRHIRDRQKGREAYFFGALEKMGGVEVEIGIDIC